MLIVIFSSGHLRYSRSAASIYTPRRGSTLHGRTRRAPPALDLDGGSAAHRPAGGSSCFMSFNLRYGLLETLLARARDMQV